MSVLPILDQEQDFEFAYVVVPGLQMKTRVEYLRRICTMLMRIPRSALKEASAPLGLLEKDSQLKCTEYVQKFPANNADPFFNLTFCL